MQVLTLKAFRAGRTYHALTRGTQKYVTFEWVKNLPGGNFQTKEGPWRFNALDIFDSYEDLEYFIQDAQGLKDLGF